ncbi:MAG: GNAT family N-acetyltransferase [Bdellovibrio sp.]
METTFRQIDFTNRDELFFIAKNDVGVPALFDRDFSTDVEAIDKMLKALEKFTPDDFCEVGVNTKNEIVAYHIIKRTPYFNRFAGSIYTLWVAPECRNQGIATEIKRRGEIWAKENALDHIYTWVHADNTKMQNLNKDLGYQIVNYKMKKKIHP